ncbi:BatD family protein [Pedobacter sp. AW31-3R]|uniref:BatD family protein n=1 Tax=Pedobacter sp. AW31-3R TaxID=3445781 RepID=UPI003F9F5E66
MTKHVVKYFLVLVILCCFTGLKVCAQETEARAKLDQSTIRIGDQTKLHLSVEQSLKERVVFPKLTDTLTSKIQVISSSKPDTIRDQRDPDRITVTKSVLLTCFDAGEYTIPAFTFGTSKGELKTAETQLSVQSVKVDTTKAIYDIKQPLAVSYTFMDWLRDNWQGVVLTLVVIAAIAGLVWYLKKRKQRKPEMNIVTPVIPVHTIALNKLMALRDKKLWQQDEVKLYYIELSDVMREYLEKRYGVKTYEKTTEEIFEGLSHKELTAEQKALLHQVLLTADLVKFAKEKPSALENEEHMERAIAFVHKTQQEPKVKDTEGGYRSEHA